MPQGHSHREHRPLKKRQGTPGKPAARKLTPASSVEDTHRDLPEERAAWEGMTLRTPQTCASEESHSNEELP